MKEDHRKIHELWHAAINAQALDRLMALYADDAVLDSAAVLVLESNRAGVLRGKKELSAHFAAFFRLIGAGDGTEWMRLPVTGSEGKTVIWEYPSAGPRGDQLDVVESFDIVDDLMVYHRVYWGRVGFKLLTDAAARERTPSVGVT